MVNNSLLCRSPPPGKRTSSCHYQDNHSGLRTSSSCLCSRSSKYGFLKPLAASLTHVENDQKNPSVLLMILVWLSDFSTVLSEYWEDCVLVAVTALANVLLRKQLMPFLLLSLQPLRQPLLATEDICWPQHLLLQVRTPVTEAYGLKPDACHVFALRKQYLYLFVSKARDVAMLLLSDAIAHTQCYVLEVSC